LANGLIRVGDLTPADIDGWDELAERSVEPNPFHSPAVVLPAARHLPGGAEVELAIAGPPSAPVAVLPVVVQRGWKRIPRRAAVTWRHDYSFLGTPLLHRDAPEDAAAQLLRVLRDTGAGLAVLAWVGLDGPASAALIPATAAVYGVQERATLVRREAITAGADALSASHRKSLRRLRRRLGERLGGDVAVVDRSTDPDAVEHFLRLEASGWKGEAGTAFLARAADTAFFRDVCAEAARRGQLEILSLESAGVTVAMQCNLLSGDGLFCWKVAYDAELGTFSPGTQLEVDAVARFVESSSPAWMDSCAEPDNELLNRLWPDRRRIATAIVPLGGAPDRAVVVALRGAIAARDGLADDRLRQLIDRRPGRTPARAAETPSGT
jgi:CelD/BcsL family acetyltransferase involved in cellulose biosynthesis